MGPSGLRRPELRAERGAGWCQWHRLDCGFVADRDLHEVAPGGKTHPVHVSAMIARRAVPMVRAVLGSGARILVPVVTLVGLLMDDRRGGRLVMHRAIAQNSNGRFGSGGAVAQKKGQRYRASDGQRGEKASQGHAQTIRPARSVAQDGAFRALFSREPRPDHVTQGQAHQEAPAKKAMKTTQKVTLSTADGAGSTHLGGGLAAPRPTLSWATGE